LLHRSSLKCHSLTSKQALQLLITLLSNTEVLVLKK
jgi:hypothetical protein